MKLVHLICRGTAGGHVGPHGGGREGLWYAPRVESSKMLAFLWHRATPPPKPRANRPSAEMGTKPAEAGAATVQRTPVCTAR